MEASRAAVSYKFLIGVYLGIPVCLALQAADHAYLLENGHIVRAGTGDELLADEHVKTSYLGIRAPAAEKERVPKAV